MKVLHVIDILNPGGAEKMFLNITSLLSENDVNVEAMLFNSSGSLTPNINNKIVVHDLDRRNKFSIAKLFKAHKICSRFDIVHVHMRHCYAYIRLAQFLFRGKYKLILHDHFGDIAIDTKVPDRLKGPFAPRYYIGVSEVLKEWAVKNLRTNGKNCFALKNIIIPHPSVNYKCKPTGKALLISNVRSTKNIEFAIRLFKKAKAPLNIYGSIVDDKYYELLKLEIGDRPELKIVEGVKDFLQHYSDFDLAIHCSKSETGPLVLLEYLAYGIPFVAYDTGAVADTVKSELPLHFMDTFDEDEWLERIQLVRSLGDISEKLQSVYRKYFDASVYVKECKEIYKSVSCS